MGAGSISQAHMNGYNLNKDNRKFQNTQDVQELGFLIGLHTKRINKNKLKLIHDSFFKIDSI